MTDTPTLDLTAPERLALSRDERGWPTAVPQWNGAYVSYEDYAALSAKLESAEAKYANAAQKALDHANQYAEMVDRVLAAEAALADMRALHAEDMQLCTQLQFDAEAAEAERDAALGVLGWYACKKNWVRPEDLPCVPFAAAFEDRGELARAEIARQKGGEGCVEPPA